MTAAELEQPPTITVTRHGTGRRYAINGRPVPGVTTILDGGYPKPALVNWSANETARWAAENVDRHAELGPVRFAQEAAKARYASNNAAKVRGTMVHDLAERISHGEEVDVPAHLVGYVDAAIRFLDDLDVDPISTEQVVASVKHGYCGTFDLYADTDRGRVLFDYKTSKSGPYPEAALQLAAYRHAEWWLWNESTQPAPVIDETAVVWLQPDRYEIFPTASR